MKGNDEHEETMLVMLNMMSMSKNDEHVENKCKCWRKMKFENFGMSENEKVMSKEK